MRFDKNIEAKIFKEIKDFPSIRYVAKKVGIHHSTLYRWILSHDEFRRQLNSAMEQGRQTTTDIAQSVIMKAIHAGDFGASKYWLSHHELRFMSEEKMRAHTHASYMQAKMLKKTKKSELDPTDFESLFILYSEYEEALKDDAKKVMDILMKGICDEDQEMIDIFYAAYEDRKDKKQKIKQIEKELGDLLSP